MNDKNNIQKSNAQSKALNWIMVFSALIISVLVPLSQLKRPEWWESQKDHNLIEKEVHHQLLNLPKILNEKYKKDSLFFINRINSNVKNINRNKLNIDTENDLIEKINKHTEFNTQVISIHSDIIWEELDKINNTCEYEYRKSNTNDNYGKFNELYDSRVIYSVDLRSGCRAYYTPIFKNKTQAE